MVQVMSLAPVTQLNVLFVVHCILQDSYIEMLDVLHLTVQGCLFFHTSCQLSENTETIESSFQWQNINTRNTLLHPLQKAKCMPVCLQVQQVTTGVRDHNCVVKTKFFNPPHPCVIVKNYETCFHKMKVVSFLRKHFSHTQLGSQTTN